MMMVVMMATSSCEMPRREDVLATLHDSGAMLTTQRPHKCHPFCSGAPMCLSPPLRVLRASYEVGPPTTPQRRQPSLGEQALALQQDSNVWLYGCSGCALFQSSRPTSGELSLHERFSADSLGAYVLQSVALPLLEPAHGS